MSNKLNLGKLAAFTLAISVTACEHGVDILGSGDVLALVDSERTCVREFAPCRFTVKDDYQEVYVAIPRAGHVFTGWEVCSSNDSSVCEFNVPLSVIEQHRNQSIAIDGCQFQSGRSEQNRRNLVRQCH